ncbi:MAG: VOC family protein [Planctomycetes bacterium]|nr:VOC family protein [Planctomycetota bacterium]
MLDSIDHVNIVVRDMEVMVRFYTGALGMRVSKRVTISGEWIDMVVGLKGVEAEVVYIEMQQGPRIELIRYLSPPGARPDGLDQPNTHGLRHIAFRVTDLDPAVHLLAQHGIATLAPTQTVPDKQVTYTGGVRKRLAYFRDPEGNILELCEYR